MVPPGVIVGARRTIDPIGYDHWSCPFELIETNAGLELLEVVPQYSEPEGPMARVLGMHCAFTAQSFVATVPNGLIAFNHPLEFTSNKMPCGDITSAELLLVEMLYGTVHAGSPAAVNAKR